MFELKIYLKNENGSRFFIPAPIWLVKAGLGMGGFGVRIARKHVSEEQLSYFENIDFGELRKALDILKKYKGLELVDVRAKDGTEVRIIV